ncbi:eukaryotic translation initiation factor 3 subunit G-2-like [Diabrotica virgifera virgifera]|uniref:RRM domain-containing protein n=1 Tax=Diabrotica virgifera virgifera TaxID=50390 RepID=A0ABM5KBZ6_DIAVI|nr:eukaryotic translation initiation factor 3 subunit G-2-like [Diabrotica virgifera virgifera]XP_050507707.1 eukaryotic translation initiation factor 3 subunit G-2-like [Diabrotica virgifera virgifera]
MGDNKSFKCSTCNGEYCTTECPRKDTMLVGGEPPDDKEIPAVGGAAVGETDKQGSKDVPQNLRDKRAKKTGGSNVTKRAAKYHAIKIDNLSEKTTRTDLEDLIKQFGLIQKRYLAEDKQTGECKGFAYVHFKFRPDAEKAIAMLHGHSYNNHVLNVDWSIR